MCSVLLRHQLNQAVHTCPFGGGRQITQRRFRSSPRAGFVQSCNHLKIKDPTYNAQFNFCFSFLTFMTVPEVLPREKKTRSSAPSPSPSGFSRQILLLGTKLSKIKKSPGFPSRRSGEQNKKLHRVTPGNELRPFLGQAPHSPRGTRLSQSEVPETWQNFFFKRPLHS